MMKRVHTVGRALAATTLAVALAACGGQPATDDTTDTTGATTEAATDSAVEEGTQEQPTEAGSTLRAQNTLALDEDALVATYPSRFTQETYADPDTGLEITYDLFLPDGYDATQSYPMIVFIGDMTCANGDPMRSLEQGRGALVWATDEWQQVHPTIVCVPIFPETIIDDRDGYATTDYVDLTKRLIEHMKATYAVDADRVYGTGQSMGCMTTLYLAANNPDLYAGCMFVDGQWDVSQLSGLGSQRFVYFAAEDDTSAWSGAQELMAAFDASGVDYRYAQWDGTWTPDELTSAADALFTPDCQRYFISWATGTVDASTASMGGMGGTGGGGSHMGAPDGEANGESGESGEMGGGPGGGESGEMGGASGGPGSAGGMGSVGYHMASFDYAYNCVAVMDWLFQQ